ncbi:MAG: hypothetical protein ACFUZC_03630 [Chthoniobacteraceae bacterium]
MNARIPTASKRGVAIVIVLAVIVLLAGMVMAFFSRVSNERSVANSDAGTLKADLLARSALGLVVSDLKQEIILTSSATTVGSGSNTSTLYTPKSASAMMPARTGTSAGIANLIRQSLRSDGLSVSSSASAVNSASDVSANGRSVSPARWNAHYLIPRLNGTSTAIDTTPIGTYTAPDWVFVNRNGRVVLTTPGSTISNPTASNSDFVVGRYAYAIYDEGGLLDINVAGCPATGSAADLGRKGSAALADLTQLPTETGTLAQSVVDQLVGWRNYATAQPTGVYPNFTIDASAASRYLSYVTGNTNGFITISGSTYNNRSDQAMLTRQQLIALGRGIGLSQNVYQYLGTFSRDLEAPSYFPNPNRPQVQASGSNNSSIFGTGNDAYNSDRNTDPATDINPPLLNVRVGVSFTRPDGTTAKVGDPLLAKRFPLSRLSLLTSSATASKSQSDAIYRNFGLYRSDATKPWMYDHGNGTGILRLSDVAALSPGREPDFFELLKAAINVGSLGKGSAYDYSNVDVSSFLTPGTSGNLQQAKDTLTQLQLLQIGANIIDQAKSDNYPTRIQFAGDTTSPKNEVRGVQDLPYFYGFRNWVTQYLGSSGTMVAIWMQPELWNPHAPRGASESSPTTFRIRVEPDPSSTATTSPIVKLSAYYAYTGTDKKTNYDTLDISGTVSLNGSNFVSASTSPSSPNPRPLVFNSGSAAGYWDFREPTLLGVTSMPATARLDSSDFANTVFRDINTNTSDTGILLATTPWTYYVTVASGSNTGTLPRTDFLEKICISSDASNYASSIRIYLDYKDASNSWITYDDQVFEYQQGAAGTAVKWIASDKSYLAKVTGSNSNWCGAIRTDPRTSRWVAQYSEYINYRAVSDSANNTWSPMRYNSTVSSSVTLLGNHLGRARDNGWYLYGLYGKQGRGMQLPYVQENSVRQTYQLDGSSYRYVRDPDGVVRRGMSGYVTDTANGGNAATAQLTGTGLPMEAGNYASRPTLLHRPFRSVAELGYVFRDTPWANLSFSFPESGDSALLDVFCINENTDSSALVAGRVNMNTRQAPVLQALIANALRDKDDSSNPLVSGTVAAELATKLVSRTTDSTPLINRADLVGRWVFSAASPAAAKTALSGTDPTATAAGPNPDNYHTGFSSDIGTVSSVISNSGNLAVSLIPRQREAVIRALADAGNTRTWNLLVDVVAQSGRFPANSSNLSNFVVDGEKRYWLHVAIDRLTGTVLDSQLEVVK